MLLKKLSSSKPRATNVLTGVAALVRNGDVTPIIGNSLATDIFDGESNIAESWAQAGEVPSPLSEMDNRDLARVAQYYSVHKNNRMAAKSDYLSTLKEYLLYLAAQDGGYAQQVEEMNHEAGQLTFSKMAYDLGYPRYDSVERNPLRLLAELPFPIYITTSHHDFLEVALEKTGRKRPESEIFYWDETLHHIESVFEREPGYEPCPERPLVYHLFGLDKYPQSLVLTEDDHLDCLARLTMLRHITNLPDDVRTVPASVKIAISGRSLLLLGYGIYGWDFRVLFRGLIQATRDTRDPRQIPRSVSMQLVADDGSDRSRRVKEFLRTYFDQSKFDVYWGTVEQCVEELWKHYRGE